MPLLLAPLTKAYDIDVWPTSDGFKILCVPLVSPEFVSSFIRKKMDAIDAFLTLGATIPEGQIVHNIHRDIAFVSRMTHLLRFIPPAYARTLWQYFDERQSAWFERICNVPRSAAARSQLGLKNVSCAHSQGTAFKPQRKFPPAHKLESSSSLPMSALSNASTHHRRWMSFPRPNHSLTPSSLPSQPRLLASFHQANLSFSLNCLNPH